MSVGLAVVFSSVPLLALSCSRVASVTLPWLNDSWVLLALLFGLTSFT